MTGFLVGLVVAMVAAVGTYYVFFMRDGEVQEQQQTTSGRVQINANGIPEGAVMEDGTLPE